MNCIACDRATVFCLYMPRELADCVWHRHVPQLCCATFHAAILCQFCPASLTTVPMEAAALASWAARLSDAELRDEVAALRRENDFPQRQQQAAPPLPRPARAPCATSSSVPSPVWQPRLPAPLQSTPSDKMSMRGTFVNNAIVQDGVDR